MEIKKREKKEKPKVFKWFWMGFFLIVWMVNQHTHSKKATKHVEFNWTFKRLNGT